MEGKMKIAEALSLRAELQKRIAQLRQRLVDNAKVQEGDTNIEDSSCLLVELENCIQQYQEIIARINLTNATIKLDGISLTEMIAKKDAQSLKVSVLRELLSAAREKINRYSNTEIRIISTVDIADLQKEVDRNSKELRELDCQLQQANWLNELI